MERMSDATGSATSTPEATVTVEVPVSEVAAVETAAPEAVVETPETQVAPVPVVLVGDTHEYHLTTAVDLVDRRLEAGPVTADELVGVDVNTLFHLGVLVHDNPVIAEPEVDPESVDPPVDPEPVDPAPVTPEPGPESEPTPVTPPTEATA